MKKVMMIVSILSLSLLLSDLCFAKKHHKHHKKGIVGTTVNTAENVGTATVDGAVNITKSVINAL